MSDARRDAVNAPFVTQLRTRGDAIDLVAGGASASEAFLIRAQVHEAWDAVRVRVTASSVMAEVKRAALTALTSDGSDPDAYVVKVRGHEVLDESCSLADVEVRAGSTVFVHARRRRPIR